MKRHLLVFKSTTVLKTRPCFHSKLTPSLKWYFLPGVYVVRLFGWNNTKNQFRREVGTCLLPCWKFFPSYVITKSLCWFSSLTYTSMFEIGLFRVPRVNKNLSIFNLHSWYVEKKKDLWKFQHLVFIVSKMCLFWKNFSFIRKLKTDPL